MRAAAMILLVLGGAVAQQSRPASRPSALDSDDALHEIAANVMPTRVAQRLDEFRRAGHAPQASPAQIPTAAPGGRKVVLSADLSDPLAVTALLETARVLDAMRKGGAPDLGFEVLFECAESRPASRPGSRPASRPSGAPLLAEIRFTSAPVGASGAALRATVAAPMDARTQAAARFDRLLGRVKGERGFWPDYEIAVDPGAGPEHASVVVSLAASASKAERRESAPAVECRAAVRIARCALIIIAHLAEDLRGR